MPLEESIIQYLIWKVSLMLFRPAIVKGLAEFEMNHTW